MKTIVAGFFVLIFAQLSHGQTCFNATKVATFDTALNLEELKSVCLSDIEQGIDRFGRVIVKTDMEVNSVAVSKTEVPTKIENLGDGAKLVTVSYRLHEKGSFCAEQVANIVTIKSVFEDGEFMHITDVSASAYHTWDNCHDTSPDYVDLGLEIVFEK